MRQGALVLSCAVPWPAVTGGRLRTARLVDALAVTYDVTVVAFTYEEQTYAGPPPGVRLVVVPYETPPALAAMQSADQTTAEAATAALEDASAQPWLAAWYDVPAMRRTLRSLPERSFDLVLVEGTDLAHLAEELPPMPRVLDLMDVCTAMLERAAAASGRPADLQEVQRLHRFESAAAAAADLVLTVSNEERHRARRLLGVDSVVVANGVDLPEEQSDAPATCTRTDCLLFVGSMDYHPNADAAQWMAESLLPSIRERRPDAHVHLVGGAPPPEVRALAGERVEVTGRVVDVGPYYVAADVVVVPIRSGGGSRLKVVEAAAHGRAMVSTTLGAEGFGLRHGHDAMLVDDATGFVEAVVHLLEDVDRRACLAQAARRLAVSYSWPTIGEQFRNALAHMGADAPQVAP